MPEEINSGYLGTHLKWRFVYCFSEQIRIYKTILQDV